MLLVLMDLIRRCPNANIAAKAYRGLPLIQAWGEIYLANALTRFKKMAPEVDWSVEDVYSAQKVS
jgi:hypothetical protein